MKTGLPLAALVLALSGCTLFHRRPPASPPVVHYVVGEPYTAGGVYQYPRAEFDLDTTGLATLIGPHGRLATDGEVFDPTALVGAHPTLQLPSVVRVTNLDNGRQVLIRLNDRGPPQRGRILALSRRAAELLGAGKAGIAIPVRVQVEEEPSRQLAAALASDQPLAISTAPMAAVRSEILPPPTGARAAAVRALAPTRAATAPTESAAGPGVPLRLPEVVTAAMVRPHALFVLEGEFGRREYAAILARRTAQLGAQVGTSHAAPRDRAWRVTIGPLGSVAQADAMLDRAIAAGVVGAGIILD